MNHKQIFIDALTVAAVWVCLSVMLTLYSLNVSNFLWLWSDYNTPSQCSYSEIIMGTEAFNPDQNYFFSWLRSDRMHEFAKSLSNLLQLHFFLQLVTIYAISNSSPWVRQSCNFWMHPCSNAPGSNTWLMTRPFQNLVIQPFDPDVLQQGCIQKLNDSVAIKCSHCERMGFTETPFDAAAFLELPLSFKQYQNQWKLQEN